METHVRVLNVPSNVCSYRTYEEWKQQLVNTDYEGEISSYRTYEEWKPS